MRSIHQWISKNKAKLCLALSFFIPVFLMLIISAVMGIYPFGDTSVLVADTRYQFVDYFGYMKNIFLGNDDLFYTFSKTFGGDMAGLYAYYLGNPLALILLLFPNRYLPIGILFLLILMIGLCGLTFNIFISEIYGYKWINLSFSIAYAFMGYMTGYFNCITYFFNILMIPIIMLGIYRIVKREKVSFLYMISLFISVFCCYYIGYMTCIFAVLFFAYQFITMYPGLKNIKIHFKTFLIFVVCSLVAVGMAAVGLLCAVLSLRGQKSSGLNISLSQKFNIFDLFSGFYSNSFHGNISDGLPLIYCGIIAITLFLMFFFNRTIKLVNKICAAIVVLILIVSFWIDGIDVAWHGFSHPIGFPYRYSFLISFFIIYIAYQSYINSGAGLIIRDYIIVAGIFGLYSAYLYVTHNQNVGVIQIVYSGVIMLGTLMAIKLRNHSKDYVIPVMVALLLISCGDAYINMYSALDAYFPGREETDDYSIGKFQDFIDETGALVSIVEKNDPEFYRMEKLYRRTNNDQMMLGYNGLSHFSSCENDTNKEFMGSLGFRNNENWAFYGDEGSTAFADCFMGVKYLLSQYDECPKPYEQILHGKEKYVYLNRNALPLAFGMTDLVKNLNNKGKNHFEYQNDIASAFTGKRFNIYKEVKDIKPNLVNVKKDNNNYTKIDTNEDAYIELNFTATRSDFIYMYFYADDFQNVDIIVNDLSKEAYFTQYGWSIREMGHYNVGDNVDLRLYLKQDTITLNDYELYYEDVNELNKWHDEVTKTYCELNKISSSHLAGKINAVKPTDCIVFSIPYEKEWTVKIDGKEVRTYPVMGCLMAVDITKGEHSIEMTYIPQGVILGTPVSLVFVVFFIIMIIWEYRKDKKYELEDEL